MSTDDQSTIIAYPPSGVSRIRSIHHKILLYSKVSCLYLVDIDVDGGKKLWQQKKTVLHYVQTFPNLLGEASQPPKITEVDKVDKTAKGACVLDWGRNRDLCMKPEL